MRRAVQTSRFVSMHRFRCREPPEVVEEVRPFLHYCDALFPVRGAVIDTADFVLVLMRERRFDNVRVILALVEEGARARAEAMRGYLLRAKAHAPQGGIERVFRERLRCRPDRREDKLGVIRERPHVVEHVERLTRKGDIIRPARFGALGRFASGFAKFSRNHRFFAIVEAAAPLASRFERNSAATSPKVLRAAVSAAIRSSSLCTAGSAPSAISCFASSRFVRASESDTEG
jgi:hypothetical protein